MAGRSQREAAEPLTVEKRFRTEFFGFDRVEVLTYIERISDANAQKARALEETITALQQDLYAAQGQNSTLERKADEVFSELKTEKKRAEEAVAEADALRKEVKKANDEIAAVRSRLFARDQENATLKNDNARLTRTVDSLTQELSGGAGRSTGRPVGQQPAPPPMPPRDEEKVQAQRARLKALRAQLAAVDAKILEATSELQRATDGITAALEGELSSQGAAVPPTSYGNETAAPYSGSDGLLGGGVPPAASVPPAIYERETAPPYSGSDGLLGRGVPPAASVPPAIYERETAPPYPGSAGSAGGGGSSAFSVPPASYESGTVPPYPSSTGSANAGISYAASVPLGAFVSTLPGPEQPEAVPQEQAAARAVPAGFSAGQYPEPFRSQYRATNGRPLPAPGVMPQGARPPEMPEQYDAVQIEARSVPLEERDLRGEKPETPVDIPKVPPRRQPESGAQVPFGKPHAPRAMPFAPFDPYTPHTAPYIEADAEAARILKTPPPPPPQMAGTAKPYVPRPTPVRTGASLSEPLVQTAETALAAMPHTESKQIPAREPVIIPYSMPIPPQNRRTVSKSGTIPFAEGWERIASPKGLKEEERRGSALSEDLLNHLNRLINGEKKP